MASEAEKRLLQYQASKDQGVPQGDAALGAMPDIAPNTALANVKAMEVPTTDMPAAALSNKEASKELSRVGVVNKFIEDGMGKLEANQMFQEVFTGVPDTVDIVAYDRLDKALNQRRQDSARKGAERAQALGEMFKDIQYAGTALHGLAGGVQQAYFSALSGEKVDNTLERLWPHADIREDDGTVARKAVIPLAAKAVSLGTIQLAMKMVTFGAIDMDAGPIGRAADKATRQLGESEYQEDLITGSEMIEYWMHGDGMFTTSLPDLGTPERENYDRIVREGNAESYALMDDMGFMGKANMAGLALFGAGYDVFADPVLVFAEAPVKLVQLARAGLPSSSKARALGTIADKSRRSGEVAQAVTAAEEWVTDSAAVLAKAPTEANVARMAHAEKYLIRMQNRVAQAQAPQETVLLRTHPRINPEHIDPIGDVYLGNPVANRSKVTRQFIKGQAEAADIEASQLTSRAKGAKAGKPGDQMQLLEEDASRLTQQAAEARGKADEWRETRRWFDKRMQNEQGSRSAAFFKKSASDKVPYEQTYLKMSDAPKGSPAVPNVVPTTAVDSVEKVMGRSAIGGVARKVDNLTRAMAEGKPAKDIRKLWDEVDELVDDVLDPKAFEYDIQAHIGETGQLREDLMDDIADALGEFSGAHKDYIPDNPLEDMAQRLGVSFGELDANGFIKVMNEIDTMLPQPPGAVRTKFQVENAAKGARRSGQGKDFDFNAWDEVVEGVRTVRERPGNPTLTKAAALKEIQRNIERAKAQDAPNSEILQWERTFSEVLASDDVTHEVIKRSTEMSDDIIATSLHEQRVSALSQPVEPVLEPGIPQRIAFGPDQTESAGEAARIIAGGGEIDDVMFHGTSVELYNSSYASRLRSASGTEGRAASAVAEAELASEVEWLGKGAVTNGLEAAEWQQTMAEKMGDQFAKGLYPKTWFPRAPWFIQQNREVMRALQSHSPRTYTRIHDAVNASEFEMTRMSSFFSRELGVLGVYKKVNGVDVLNPDEAAKFFRVMNIDPTTDDFVRALSTLSEAERRSLGRIRDEMDFMKNKQGLEGTPLTIEGYIDHVFDPRWMDSGARPGQWQGGTAASPEIFTPHLLPRSGNAGYTEDLALALDNYTRSVGRKLHIEPLLDDLVSEAQRTMKQDPGNQWYADYLMDITANLKGQPSTLGNWVDRNMSSLNARMRASESTNDFARGVGVTREKLVGPAMTKAGEGLSKQPGPVGRLGAHMQSEGVRITADGSKMAVNGMPRYIRGDASRTALGVSALSYTSVLGGSGRYFPMAIATGMATTGSKFNSFKTLEGMLTMATPEGRALAKQVGLEKQWVKIMDDAAWTKVGQLASKMPSLNGGTVLGPSIAGTENTIRGWTMHAAMGDLIRKNGFSSWNEVVKAGRANEFVHESLRITEEVNHLFGMLGKPPAFGRMSKSGSTAATQFLSFIPKQTEELLAQTLQNPGRIGQYMMISGYLQRTAAKAGLDVSEYVGMGFLPNSPDETTSIATEAVVAFFDHAHAMSALATQTGGMDEAQRTGEALSRNFQNFIPTMLAVQRTTRSVETSRLQKIFAGEKMIRDVDLGRFEWDENQNIAQNLARMPMAFAPKEGTGPTEALANLSGMDSIEGTLERQQYQAMVTDASNRIFRRMAIADAWQDAIDTGNSEGARNQMVKAIEEGMLPPDIDAMIERSSLEHTMPRLLRAQLKSDQALIDGIESSQKKRAEYDLRFNR